VERPARGIGLAEPTLSAGSRSGRADAGPELDKVADRLAYIGGNTIGPSVGGLRQRSPKAASGIYCADEALGAKPVNAGLDIVGCWLVLTQLSDQVRSRFGHGEVLVRGRSSRHRSAVAYGPHS
jgi:hypothetical protein